MKRSVAPQCLSRPLSRLYRQLILGAEVLAFAALATSMTGAPSGGYLVELSTRGYSGLGLDALIAGFITTGSTPKTLVVRGLGPSLPLAHTLPDPDLAMYTISQGLVGYNDDWGDTQRSEILSVGLAPADEDEAAILTTLSAKPYTAVLYGEGLGAGTSLVEIYDLNPGPDSRLSNISTRGLVQTGSNVLIAGFIIAGDAPLDVILRAIGPSMSDVVGGTLANPTLELYDANGDSLAFNDNWRQDQEEEVSATGIPPEDNAESAIVGSLSPGAYTAVVRGTGVNTGLALVEVYALD